MDGVNVSYIGYYRDRRQKKESNLNWSMSLIENLAAINKLSYELKNSGYHCIVRAGGKTVDFWPSTGKYIVRGGKTGRGVFNMLREIGINVKRGNRRQPVRGTGCCVNQRGG